MTFFDAMQDLATAVAGKAADPDTPLAASTDALKALTPYFAILYKANKADVDGEMLTFGDLKADIEAVAEKQHHGTVTTIPSRRRRDGFGDDITPSQRGRTVSDGHCDADVEPQGAISARPGSPR